MEKWKHEPIQHNNPFIQNRKLNEMGAYLEKLSEYILKQAKKPGPKPKAPAKEE